MIKPFALRPGQHRVCDECNQWFRGNWTTATYGSEKTDTMYRTNQRRPDGGHKVICRHCAKSLGLKPALANA